MSAARELWAEYELLKREDAPAHTRGRAWTAWFETSIREGNDPSRLRRDAPTLPERIDARIIEGLDGCLIWDGSLGKYGKPYLHAFGQNINVRRWILERAGITATQRQRIGATCGNSRCVALGHLVVEAPWSTGKRWTQESMTGALQVVAMRLGRTPLAFEWDKARYSPHSSWFGETFGSWAKACLAAGLEPNTRRKTHCQRGHPRTGDNIYVDPTSGSRRCRECKRAADRASRLRRAAQRRDA